MISFNSQRRVFVSTRPVDFRTGVHGLVALVATALGGDPYSGDVFVFRAKRNDRLKLLFFDGSGMVLATKWLDVTLRLIARMRQFARVTAAYWVCLTFRAP